MFIDIPTFPAAAFGAAALQMAEGNHQAFKCAIVSDVKAYNVSGGTFTAGADRTRDLNTESDPYSIVTLASNAFTPIAGTYVIEWRAAVYGVDRNVSKLWNKTAGTLVKLGTSLYSGAAFGDCCPSTGAAIVTCNGTDEYEIRHRCAVTSVTYGFGVSHDIAGMDTVYTEVILTKIL